MLGDVQVANAAPSREHANVDTRLARRELEGGARARRRAGGPGVDRRLRRVRVHGERAARRRRIDVAGGVARSHVERVRTVGERRGRVRRDAGRERGGADAALERRPGVARERERRRRVARRPAGPGVDRRLRCCRVDRERACRRRTVDVARRVGRLDREGVRSVAERRGRVRRRAARERAAVERALEARAGLAREGERGRVVVGRTRGAAVDARLRRLRVHREGAARRRVVDVAGGVGRRTSKV